MSERPQPPFNRWGRIIEPSDSRGAYLLIEREDATGWKKAPPADAIRVWHRTPGAADDDDLNNWTVWMRLPQLADWLAGYTVEEWLPEGVEPSWSER